MGGQTYEEMRRELETPYRELVLKRALCDVIINQFIQRWRSGVWTFEEAMARCVLYQSETIRELTDEKVDRIMRAPYPNVVTNNCTDFKKKGGS